MVFPKAIHPFIRYYLPVLIWSGFIFYLSSVPDLKVGAQEISWEILLRKAAHIGEYSLLAFLCFRAAHFGLSLPLHKALAYAILFVLVFSITDEIHQTYVVGRTGKSIDVLIDVLGAMLGLALVTIYRNIMRKTSILILLILMAALSVMVVKMVKEGQLNAEKQELFSVVVEDQEGRVIGQRSDDSSEEKAAKELNDQNTTREDGTSQPVQAGVEEEKQKTPPVTQPTKLPKKVQIGVPFTSQAPYANWDALHEEACEEASLIMVRAFLKKEPLTPEKAEEQIQKLAEFQNKSMGDYHDSDMAELVDIAKKHYGINNLSVVYDFSKEELKRELAKGNPVIVPTAGRRLGNPNFKNPGPLYHNLVVVGYEGNDFITNDPGTRKGEGFIYHEDILFEAIHDFPGKKEEIEKGRKAMIVVR